MKTLIALLFASASLSAQQANWFATTGAVSSASGTAATIQQPAANAEQIQLSTVEVTCPAACVITQRQNDTTPATATAGSVRGLQPYNLAAFALTFWTSSNATGGVTTGITPCTAACTVVFDLSGIYFGGTGATTNYTVAISASIGNAYITFRGKRLQ